MIIIQSFGRIRLNALHNLKKTRSLLCARFFCTRLCWPTDASMWAVPAEHVCHGVGPLLLRIRANNGDSSQSAIQFLSISWNHELFMQLGSVIIVNCFVHLLWKVGLLFNTVIEPNCRHNWILFLAKAALLFFRNWPGYSAVMHLNICVNRRVSGKWHFLLFALQSIYHGNIFRICVCVCMCTCTCTCTGTNIYIYHKYVFVCMAGNIYTACTQLVYWSWMNNGFAQIGIVINAEKRSFHSLCSSAYTYNLYMPYTSYTRFAIPMDMCAVFNHHPYTQHINILIVNIRNRKNSIRKGTRPAYSGVLKSRAK